MYIKNDIVVTIHKNQRQVKMQANHTLIKVHPRAEPWHMFKSGQAQKKNLPFCSTRDLLAWQADNQESFPSVSAVLVQYWKDHDKFLAQKSTSAKEQEAKQAEHDRLFALQHKEEFERIEQFWIDNLERNEEYGVSFEDWCEDQPKDLLGDGKELFSSTSF